MYMNEPFCHHAHVSQFSYFWRDPADGVMHDGFGRTTGKGLRRIMMNAITKFGGLATASAEDLPATGGWFKENTENKGKGKGKGKSVFTVESGSDALISLCLPRKRRQQR